MSETVWTTCGDHRIELWEDDDGQVALMEVRVDVRRPYADFLDQVVDLANRSRCVLYLIDEDEFIDASSVGLFEALTRSHATTLANSSELVADTH